MSAWNFYKKIPRLMVPKRSGKPHYFLCCFGPQLIRVAPKPRNAYQTLIYTPCRVEYTPLWDLHLILESLWEFREHCEFLGERHLGTQSSDLSSVVIGKFLFTLRHLSPVSSVVSISALWPTFSIFLDHYKDFPFFMYACSLICFT